MYLKPFKTGEAEPLRSRRIWPPVILRRFSDGNAAALPPAIRWVGRQIAGGMPAVQPPELPAIRPGDYREVAGKLPGGLRASQRSMSRKFPPENRRSAVGITAAFAGQLPKSFPSYDQH